MTPFADAVEDWLYEWARRERRKPSHAQLARLLSDAIHSTIRESTVGMWFSRGTLPDARSFHAVQRVTGWADARMLELTGYAEVPAYEPSVWEFIANKLLEPDAKMPGPLREIARQRLETWRREYEARPRRPARRGSGKRPATTAVNAPNAPTPLPSRAADREPNREPAGAK